jgi:hypothetical protein
MAPPKGHPRWGGKQKGTKNVKTTARERLLQQVIAAALTPEQAAELMPLEIMRAVMRDRYRAGDYDGALLAAEKAAPYCHARLTSTEMKVSGSLSFKSDAEIAADILELERRIQLALPPPVDSPPDPRSTPAVVLPEASPAPADGAAERQTITIPRRQLPVEQEPSTPSVPESDPTEDWPWFKIGLGGKLEPA